MPPKGDNNRDDNQRQQNWRAMTMDATKQKVVLYECDICDCLHPWEWDADCRDDANRYSDELDYAERNTVDLLCIEVVPMIDRVNADFDG